MQLCWQTAEWTLDQSGWTDIHSAGYPGQGLSIPLSEVKPSGYGFITEGLW
jgi:hypothetical protein